MNKLLLSCIIWIALISCDTKYRQLKNTISRLPPNKLLQPNNNGSSGVTSKVDSLTGTSLTTDQRLAIVLDLTPSSLREGFESYKRRRTNNNFDKVVRNLNKFSIDKDITVKVRIKTRKQGATVKYHTQAVNDVVTANNPTNDCYIKFNIGYYYIWTERDEKKTAIPQRYFISMPDSITIAERIKR